MLNTVTQMQPGAFYAVFFGILMVVINLGLAILYTGSIIESETGKEQSLFTGF